MAKFRAFVILAGMRTGSNHLEATLSELPGLSGHGELFNPGFIGSKGRTEAFGFDLKRRERDPWALVEAIIAASGETLPGFRLFHDHDARVLDRVLADPSFAKVVLTRNPLDSFLSLQIARETGRWRMTDMPPEEPPKVRFDADAFAAHVAAQRGFLARIRRALQVSGQTAFHLRYPDINEPEVIAGLIRFLDADADPDAAAPSGRFKPQNPGPAAEKVTNPEEMSAALAEFEVFEITSDSDVEALRPPGVPGFVALKDAGLAFLPIRSVAEQEVGGWMAALGEGQTATGMTQKKFRQWMRRHPGHRKFTILRHPARRAHDLFCRFILPAQVPGFEELRDAMRVRYGVPLPAGDPGADWDAAAHRDGFREFLTFAKANLAGQTRYPARPVFMTQSAALASMAQFTLPDLLIREEEMGRKLPAVAREIGLTPPKAPRLSNPGPVSLETILDRELEDAIFDIYRRDYLFFGFRRLAAD